MIIEAGFMQPRVGAEAASPDLNRPLRLGSLCTGTGALDMAVERVLGAKMVWYSEFEKHPSTLLSARFPGIPNLGDLTRIDWRALVGGDAIGSFSVDILTGGYP